MSIDFPRCSSSSYLRKRNKSKTILHPAVARAITDLQGNLVQIRKEGPLPPRDVAAGSKPWGCRTSASTHSPLSWVTAQDTLLDHTLWPCVICYFHCLLLIKFDRTIFKTPVTRKMDSKCRERILLSILFCGSRTTLFTHFDKRSLHRPLVILYSMALLLLPCLLPFTGSLFLSSAS